MKLLSEYEIDQIKSKAFMEGMTKGADLANSIRDLADRVKDRIESAQEANNVS